MTFLQVVLAQCPCSGGGSSSGGDSGPSPWLILLAFAADWFLVRYIWNRKGASTMSKFSKIAIFVALAVAVIAVVVIKKSGAPASPQPTTQMTAGLPRLLDLGSSTCIPCKMMAPILEDLKKEYAGRMDVDFIDVNADGEAAKRFAIKLIPTQVFFDASGKELWRHEGFFSKEDILAKWKDLGAKLTKTK